MVFTENKPNGPLAWIATRTYSKSKAVQLRKDLARGLDHSAPMLEDNRAAIKAAAAKKRLSLRPKQ